MLTLRLAKLHHQEPECRARWGHYDKSPPNRSGFGTLHWLAEEADKAARLRLWGKVEAAS